MKGREKSHPEVAEEVMGQFVVMITKPYDFIQEPKLIGDSVYATIKPKA
jgi:translation initiation factor IF-3